MTTLAEQWKYEGRLEGEARGRLEGEARGRLEGARLLLLAQLETKFGILAEHERERVGAATEDELARWAAEVLTASSLDDVLGK